ncbi:MAG: hypothetical protein M1536_07865 [Firmicutes bacterium]|nr:hypothetical protein [Bacillota bacterium]
MAGDPIIEKLLEHDRRFDRLEEKFDKKIDSLRDEFLTRTDKILVILQRLDQERVFTNEAIRRLEEQQENQQKELNKIKQILKIV